jgi:hypothetical protein
MLDEMNGEGRKKTVTQGTLQGCLIQIAGTCANRCC